MTDVFMTVTISLRITSQALCADAIEDALGRVSSIKWSKGDARATPSGKVLHGVRTDSYANFLLVEKSRVWLSLALNDCNTQLAKHREFFSKIRREGGRAELFVGWFLERDGGDVLPYKLLAGIAALELDLSLDVYPERTLDSLN